jgi:hypothetical protein
MQLAWNRHRTSQLTFKRVSPAQLLTLSIDELVDHALADRPDPLAQVDAIRAAVWSALTQRGGGSAVYSRVVPMRLGAILLD